MSPTASNNAQKTVPIRDVMKDPAPEQDASSQAGSTSAVQPAATPTPAVNPTATPKIQAPATVTPAPTPSPAAPQISTSKPAEQTPEDNDENWDKDDEALDIPEDFDTEKLKQAPSAEETSLSSEELRLQTAWFAMLETIFAADPLVLYPLKQHLPLIEDNVLNIRVNNSMQVERLKQKKELVLQFMQTQYDANLQEVKPLLDAKLEAQKAIFDNKDKLQHFHEENSEFGEFINILNLIIKDE